MYSEAEKLHKEHNIWLSDIEILTTEIEFLRKKLLIRAEKCEKPNKQEILKNYLNRLKHFDRLMTNMKEVINSHELFMKDNLSSLLKSDDIDVSMVEHNKTERHMKELKQKLNQLKKEISKF